MTMRQKIAQAIETADCHSLGFVDRATDAILNILNEYGEEEIEAALRAFIWRGAEVLEQDEAEVEQQFADMDAQGKLAVREGLRAAIKAFLGTLS